MQSAACELLFFVQGKLFIENEEMNLNREKRIEEQGFNSLGRVDTDTRTFIIEDLTKLTFYLLFPVQLLLPDELDHQQLVMQY